MNTHVNFETAKLLKEKRFDKRSEKRYGTKSGILYNDAVINDLEDDVFTAAPTIAEVVYWLYEKHGIWISVTKDVDIKWSNDYFNYHILSPQGTTQSDIGGTKPTSPTEAYQKAINYTLKNLIK